jgi:UDP-N-acetylmuramoylalanine--D-glutamate ligase
VAVWTNFSANHLDRYPDVASYRAAKLRIFDRQTADDFAVVNARSELPALRARRISFAAARAVEADFTMDDAGTIMHRGRPLLALSATRLRGPHNAENLMAAMAAATCLGLDLSAVIPAACRYTPPPHRCELVAEGGGVTWINDSKSTNLDALARALEGQTGGVILIAGGKNKGFDYAPLAPLVGRKARAAVLIGEMRDSIAADWAGSVPCHPVATLEAAVATAGQLARAGDTVLFSPGTSSFDMFRSYEERGDIFKQLTHHTKTTTPQT